MTREQQIAVALEVLKPPPDRVAVCRRDIEMTPGWVESTTEARTKSRIFVSGKGKDGLRSYKNALDYAQARRAKVDPAIRPWLRADLLGEIAWVEKLLAKRSQPKRDAIKKKVAAAAAHNLLVWWGHKPVTTRGGNWDLLAKALAGIDATATSLHGHLNTSNLVPLIIVRDKNGSRLLINNSEEARRLLRAMRPEPDQKR
jgi:hypothetical protein